MGLGSSRGRFGRQSYEYKQHKYRQHQFKKTSTTSIPIIPINNNYYRNGTVYPYAGVQPSPYASIGYNPYPQPYMMMMPSPPPRVPANVPSPYQNPPLPPPPGAPIPYVQQQVPMQPVYNNINSPPVVPAPYYPPVYQSSPARLLTDWTGGGKISPGFLGPPI